MEPEMELLIALAKVLEPLHPHLTEVTAKVVARAEDRVKSYAAMRFEQAERLKAVAPPPPPPPPLPPPPPGETALPPVVPVAAPPVPEPAPASPTATPAPA